MSLAVLEYEEQFGRLWHRLVGERASLPHFPEAAVRLEDERRRLGVLFRGIGGDPGLELVAGAPAGSPHRLRLLQRLGMAEERLVAAERTAELVILPPLLDCLPTPALNRDLFVWLVAFLAGAAPAPGDGDPLRRDILRLRAAAARTATVLAAFPGLHDRHAALAAALLALRPARRLPPQEARVEAAMRRLHGDMAATGDIVELVLSPEAELSGLSAAKGYRPYLPSPLWGEVRSDARLPAAGRPDDAEPGAAAREGEDDRHRRARRRTPEEEGGRDPLTLINKGEYLLLATEAVGVSRAEDDEEPEAARRAADDMDEITLGGSDRPAASRIHLNLDLPAPHPPAATPQAAAAAYPEWDWRRGRYRSRHCTVRAVAAPETGEDWAPDATLRRHIAHVRRRFEVLRPQREVRRAQPDGGDLDMEALVRVRTDLAAGVASADRIHLDVRNLARDLA
ncbi:MAG: protein norD, partial [Geminicoccaceae bacterium]